MVDVDTLEAPPQVEETPPQTPPDTTGDAKLRLLHTAIGKEYNLGSFDEFKQKIQDPTKRQKLYDAVGKEYDLGSYDDFESKLGFKGKPQVPPVTPPPEHEISHTPIQDIRHVKEMVDRPVSGVTLSTGPYSDPNAKMIDPEEVAKTKAYQAQYDKLTTDLGAQWGAKPAVVKQVIQDFPDEQDENKLKASADLATSNPVGYGRLKNANDIRLKIAKDGPNGVHDANVFNHLLDAQDYHQLTEENIPYQMQLMRQHNLGEADIEQLKQTQRPLINSMDPGLLSKYWGSKDKEYGLTPDEYAGLETERLFNPNKAQMDESIIKHSRGIGEDGKSNPLDMSTQPYSYQRGVENVKYNLAQTGRANLSQYVAEHKANTDKQADDLAQQYQQSLSFATNPAEHDRLVQEFNNHPIIQEANKLQEAAEGLKYSESEDNRLYPLNFSDQATRIVRDAMENKGYGGQDVANVANKFASGAFNTYKETWDFVKNLAINIAGNDEQKAFNNAESQGQKSISDITGYYGAQSSGTEQPLNVPRETISAIQAIQNDPNLTVDQKHQKSIQYVKDNWDTLSANPKAGQQNLTGKSVLYSAADMAGQIVGIASQSFLMGGAIGNASKLQRLTAAFAPMYMSTQDQLYQDAVKNGEEHPLLKSNLDAAIISLASLINPDLKVVKAAAGIDTPVAKMLQGVTEDTWNKVLSTNKPIFDQMSGGIKATARQLALANLQYGLIAPTAQYIAHKGILGEDANLGDMIKDGVIQTSIQMAAPALLHGLWGGIKATQVNPMQKYALVEAGLHPDENIDLIDSKIKSGLMSEVKGHEIKMLIKHAGEFMLDPNLKMTDGTPMNEKQVADNLYNSIKKKALENSLKGAPEPLKPVIEEKIHEVNKEIADGFTSDSDKQKLELNQLLHDNLDRIKNKAPEFEQTAKDAIAANTPEEAFKIIADKANETKKVEGKETSLRSEAEDIYGKPLVEKALELSKQKSKVNGKTNETNAKAEGQVAPKPEDASAKEGSASSIQPTSDKIQPTDVFRTWDLGDMEGTPEDAAAKKHIEGVVEAWDKHPAGETGGETFGSFVNRVIPAFDKVLKEEQHNTTIVTHSSVLKAMRVWDEMGRPEVDKLTPEQKKEFADKYNETETHNGDLETFKGANGDIRVVRHGQTEDNAKNNFRSGNTNLTEKGIQDAHAVGEELKAKTGGDVPKIISSDLPRAIHTSNIITDKLSNNAIPEQSAGAVDVRQQTGDGEAVGGGNTGSEVPPEEGGSPQAQQNGSEVPPGQKVGQGNYPFVEPSKTGVAERIKKEREFDAGVKAPQPGEGMSKQQMVDLGRQLLKDGRDPEQAMQNFENDPEKNISTNAMALSVARLEQLAKTTDKAIEDYGEESKEADAAREVESRWAERVQPMQTEWSKIGQGQKGATEVDTGSVTSLKRSFRESSGKPLTEKQAETAKQLRSKIKQHEDRIDELVKERDALKTGSPSRSTTFADKAKKAADVVRKLKNKEFTFKDSSGNDIPVHKMGVSWNDIVELGAKAIEKTGEIADGIAAIIDKVKDADWYKALSKDDQDRFGKELENHYASIADKKTAARIKSLEKQLDDLQSGKVKTKGEPRLPTAREQELKDQIFDAKRNLGLLRPKGVPTPKTKIGEPKIDIATHFVGKQDKAFTPKEADAIWDHAKDVIKNGDKEDFHGVISQVAMDTGLTADQINHAIDQPKGAKSISNKMYAETYRRNQVKRAAAIWVKSADQSAEKKFWSKVIKVPSAIVTALHGSVAPITHVGGDLYRPSNWKSYFNFMLNSYTYSFGGITEAGKARYEKAMGALVRDPMYTIALEAGVRCNPTDLHSDDYSNYQSVFGRLSKMGERGFNAMKPYRLEQFKKYYNDLSDQAKGNKEVRKAIGQIVNLQSGTTSVNTGKYTDIFVFAPKLIVSQYQRIFTEPAKAIGTLIKGMRGKEVTDAEKLQATMVAKHSAQMITTYLAGLAANQAILTMTGSKQKINFTNPLDADWMKFKVGGKDVDASGGMNSALRFVGSLVEEGLRANGVIKTAEKGKPGDTEGRKILQQATNKLSPAAGDVAELFSGTDNAGNSLPWSSVKPSAGREKLTWAEYFESKSPIFLAEGFKAFNESAKSNGLPKATLNNYLEGVVTGVLAGTTGAHISPDNPKKATGGRAVRGGGR
jgi:broad specificity phosphatase PhoE